MKRKYSVGKYKKPRRLFIEKEVVFEISKWIFQVAIVCILAFVLVWGWGREVTQVGDSMKPIIENGDTLLVDRVSYRIFMPKRGDVVAFQPNGNDNAYDSIKRIVGLPGESVIILEGDIYINGEKFEEEYATSAIEESGIAEQEIMLGEDEYFLLGDNRISSNDSRMADIGNVNKSEITGKIWFRTSPTSKIGTLKEEK